MSRRQRKEGGKQASGRLWQIDALRGLMLVLMTITHVPTRFVSPVGQRFGYVSAAKGFVLLSAFMAGWIYTGPPTRHSGRIERATRRQVIRGANVRVE